MDEKIVLPTFNKKVLAGNPSAVKKEEPKPEPVVEEVEPKETVEESTDVPEDQKVNPTELDPNEPLFHAVSDYLGGTDERDQGQAVQKIRHIVDFVVNEYGSNAYEDVMEKISELSHKIVKPDFGVKMYKHLYRYVRLLEAERSNKRAINAWEGRRWDSRRLETNGN